MRRVALLAIWLTFLSLSACLPAPHAEVGAPRLPKSASPEVTPTPESPGEPNTRATPVPAWHPSQIVPKAWAQPFTYGPRFPLATPIPPPVQPRTMPSDAVNILLLGSDRRSGTSFRTDTIILVSIHPSSHAVVMLSIPRDLYIYIPGYNMQRINVAFGIGENYDYPGGGFGMLSDAILYNFGITVHYYAKVEMAGFRQIIDRLGGVDVHAACSYTDWRLRSPQLNPEDSRNWHLFTVPAGIVHMNGDYALWYARSRKRSSDFDRGRRQQEVLRAIYRQALRLDLIPRLPALYDDFQSAVTTNMGLSDLIRLAPIATQIDISNVRGRFIGRDHVTGWRTPTGGAVLLPKPDAIQALLDETFDLDTPDPVVPEAPVSVEVINASGRSDWGTLAAERLIYAGFDAYAGLEVDEPVSRSQLIDLGLASEEERQAVLQALGLRSSAVQSASDPTSNFAFRLIVGQDYRPCFDPTRQ